MTVIKKKARSRKTINNSLLYNEVEQRFMKKADKDGKIGGVTTNRRWVHSNSETVIMCTIEELERVLNRAKAYRKECKTSTNKFIRGCGSFFRHLSPDVTFLFVKKSRIQKRRK